jgi:hypothetical protein
MITIICLTRKKSRGWDWWQSRWPLTMAAAAVCGVVFAGAKGAQLVDSGWAVATPTPITSGTTPGDPAHQMVLRQVLEQAQQPLLIKRSPSQLPQANTEQSQGGVRFAVRPDGIDGWRPASEPFLPFGQPVAPAAPAPVPPAAAPAEAPQTAGPAPSHDAQDLELDCGATDSETALIEDHHPSLIPPTNAAKQAPAEEVIVEEAIVEEATAPPVTDAIPADSAPDLDIPATDETTDTSAGAATPAAEAAPPVDDELADIGPVAGEPDTAADKQEDGDSEVTAPVQQVPVVAPPVVKAPPPLTRQLVNLRNRVRSVLKGYSRKQLNSRDHDPWEAMHGMLAYGVQSRIRDGGPRGEPITSVGWLCFNKPCKGQSLLYVTPQGGLRAKYGVGLQGHLGQFLAMLAQCKVSPDYPIHVGKKKDFTVRDLIEAEKKTCYPKSELTFKLLALQHYIDLSDTWVNDQGVEWDFSRLIREELAQPIRSAACGGTHRLSALSLTVKARIRRGEPVDGEYLRAQEFVKKYQMFAFRLQNGDGSLSTSWFRGRGDEDDIDRRIKTTGHILEWLCYSLSDEELRDARTIRAVTYLANLMYSNYDRDWEVGPMCHATHALLLYDERVYMPFDKPGEVASYRSAPTVARKSGSGTVRR